MATSISQLKTGDGSFEIDASSHLASEGFYVLDFATSETSLGIVREDIQWRTDDGLFKPPAQELQAGLLGEGSNGLCHLEAPSGETTGSSGINADVSDLKALDMQLTTLAMVLAPFAEECMGFNAAGRSPSVIIQQGGPNSELPPLALDEGVAWLDLFRMHRLMVIVFLGPGDGTLELRLFDDDAAVWSIPARPGSWVLLRPDILERNFKANATSHALVCWILGDARGMPAPFTSALEAHLMSSIKAQKQLLETEEEFEKAVTRKVQMVSNRALSNGMRIAVRAIATKFPGSIFDEDAFWCIGVAGGDLAIDLPLSRWRVDDMMTSPEEYENLSRKDLYTTTCHGVFMEGVDQFDNKFFGVSISESRGMDPNQYHVLEVSYSACLAAGYDKPALMKKWCGVYTAGSLPESGSIERDATDVGSTGASLAITSNRVSYVLGLMGPNFSMNVEGAGSVLTTAVAADTLLPGRNQNDSALSIGTDLIVAKPFWAGMSLARRLSVVGRCLTWDASADGFIRADGCGGVYLDALVPETGEEEIIDKTKPCRAVIEAGQITNAGKSAKLGAPSGIADQGVLLEACRRARISPLDIDVLECFGLGNPLHDAVESVAAGCALRPRQRAEEEPESLVLTCIKTNLGNAGPAAGMKSILKAICCAQQASITSSLHLKVLNPALDLGDMPVSLATEQSACRLDTTFVGVTGKGWGGTIAHLVLRASKVEAEKSDMLISDQIAFWPGGGGDLPGRSKARKGYFIVGTWTDGEPVSMEPAGQGAYTHTLTLGEAGFERFHIVLDGDKERVLHPGYEDSPKDVKVKGPDTSDVAGSSSQWIIDGRTLHLERAGEYELIFPEDKSPKDDLVPVSFVDRGEPGDQYCITLQISGKFRRVTWSKVKT